MDKFLESIKIDHWFRMMIPGFIFLMYSTYLNIPWTGNEKVFPLKFLGENISTIAVYSFVIGALLHVLCRCSIGMLVDFLKFIYFRFFKSWNYHYNTDQILISKLKDDGKSDIRSWGSNLHLVYTSILSFLTASILAEKFCGNTIANVYLIFILIISFILALINDVRKTHVTIEISFGRSSKALARFTKRKIRICACRK